MPTQTPSDEVRVRLAADAAPHSAAGEERRFADDFCIGRGSDCAVRVASGKASRAHVEVFRAEGAWWVRDLDSTNGTFVDGEKLTGRRRLRGATELRLGQHGARVKLAVGDAGKAPPFPATSPVAEAPLSASERPGGSRPEASVEEYVQRYFDEERGDEGDEAGQHTKIMRRAYRRVQKKRRLRYWWIIGGLVAACLCVAAYAFVQRQQNQRLRATARDMFQQLKAQDLAISNLKRYATESGDATLTEKLAALEERREKQAAQYEGYVDELGLRRDLSQKEELIYRVARIFNESEFAMPAGFIRRVREEIDTYWTTPAGKRRFTEAVARAARRGYTPIVVETMREYGLPPEFFYLAMQESNFDPEAVGPRTRWGIAKGAWQFIPSTARTYGLRVGPREDVRVVDQQDERHDFRKATAAAARYLQQIYSTPAQASGLLVIASYNWGEHRVNDKLERLPGPQQIPEAALEGIPKDPEARGYWRFLTEYADRMPDQTKDYVIKIVAAVVVGQNPRLFGIDLDNPLRPHMKAPKSQLATVHDPVFAARRR